MSYPFLYINCSTLFCFSLEVVERIMELINFLLFLHSTNICSLILVKFCIRRLSFAVDFMLCFMLLYMSLSFSSLRLLSNVFWYRYLVLSVVDYIVFFSCNILGWSCVLCCFFGGYIEIIWFWDVGNRLHLIFYVPWYLQLLILFFVWLLHNQLLLYVKSR